MVVNKLVCSRHLTIKIKKLNFLIKKLIFLINRFPLLSEERKKLISNMVEKKINLNDAYSLKTPEDSIELYKKWAQTYDKDFAVSSNYQSPKEISIFFNKHSKNTDTPILDVGAGTGLVGELLNSKGKKEITGIDISSEMLDQAKLKGCYSCLVEADITKKIPLNDNSFGAVVSAGTFTHGHV